jgi:hypothetical protein
MPGNDFVIKQNVLGSAAGIALLAFALAWRFLPSFSGGTAPEKAVAEPPSSAPMSVTAPKEAAPAKPVAAQEQPVETPVPAPPAKPAPPPPKAIAALLRKADTAFADGRLVEPKDTSALALYTQVLDAERTSAVLSLP